MGAHRQCLAALKGDCCCLLLLGAVIATRLCNHVAGSRDQHVERQLLLKESLALCGAAELQADAANQHHPRQPRHGTLCVTGKCGKQRGHTTNVFCCWPSRCWRRVLWALAKHPTSWMAVNLTQMHADVLVAGC